MCVCVLVRQAIELYGLAVHFVLAAFISFVALHFIISFFGFINSTLCSFYHMSHFISRFLCLKSTAFFHNFSLAISLFLCAVVSTKRNTILHFLAFLSYVLASDWDFVCAFRGLVSIVFHVTFGLWSGIITDEEEPKKKNQAARPNTSTHFFLFVPRIWQEARVCCMCSTHRAACAAHKRQFIVIVSFHSDAHFMKTHIFISFYYRSR